MSDRIHALRRRHRPNRAAAASTVGALVAVALVGIGARPSTGAAQETARPDGPPLALVTQAFAVRPGEPAHFVYDLNVAVPEITNPTTTTTTTTTTTSTTTPPGPTFPPEHPYAGAAIPPELWSDFGIDPANYTTTTTVAPTTTTVPPGPDLTVRVIARQPVATRRDVALVYGGRLPPPVDIVELDLADVAEVVDGTARITLDVPVVDGERVAGDRRLELTRAGLYPVSIEIRRDGVTEADHLTFVERLPATTAGTGTLGKFRLSVVAGLADPGPEITEQELLLAVPQLAELAAAADAVGTGLTAAVPPELTRRVFAAQPELATTVRTALAGSELVELPAQPLDPSAAAAATGVADELTGLRAAGAEQLGELFPDVDRTDAVWLVDAPITRAGAALIADLGATTLVVPYDHYARLPGNVAGFVDPSLLATAALDDVAGGRRAIDVAIVDPITDLLDPDREITDTPAGDAVALLASITAIRHQLGPDVRGFVLARPDFGVPDADVLTHLVELAGGLPDVEFVRLSEMVANTNHLFVNGDVHLVGFDEAIAVDLAPRMGRVRELNLLAVDAGSMLPTDDPRPQQWQTALQSALSTGLTDAEAAALLGSVDAQITAVRSAVQAPEAYQFTLPSRRAEVPLRIENTSDTPLTVLIRMTAEKLEMVGGDHLTVLEPGRSNEVEVEVEARSNGAFPVVVEVLTPFGNPLTEPVELQARVNTFTGLGWLITAAAALVLASWWYSHLRRRHRERVASGLDAARRRHPGRWAGDTFAAATRPRTGAAAATGATAPEAEPDIDGGAAAGTEPQGRDSVADQ